MLSSKCHNFVPGKQLEEVEGLFAQPWFSMSKPAMMCGGASEKNVQYLHIRGFSGHHYDHGTSSDDDDACSDTTH